MPSPIGAAGRRKRGWSLQGALLADRNEGRASSSSSTFLRHRLRAADVHGKGSVLFCASCGAYAWASPRALLDTCPGPRRSAGRTAQRHRLAQGRFPSARRAHWRLGPPRPVTTQVTYFLEAAATRRSQAFLCPRDRPGSTTGGLDQRLSRQQVLERYGLTEEAFRHLVEKTRSIEQARKRGPCQHQDPDFFYASDAESEASMSSEAV